MRSEPERRKRRVVWRYALRNALVPLVTLLGLQLPHLVGGSVVVERVFGIPGMGLWVVDASAVPATPRMNPQLTVMAMALRAAGKLEAKLEKTP